MLPWANPRPNLKRHRFSHFLHRSLYNVAILYNEPPLPRPSKLPIPMGEAGPHLTFPWAAPESLIQTASRSVQSLCKKRRAENCDRQTDRCGLIIIIISGQSNVTQGRIAAAHGPFQLQSYLPGCANKLPCNTCFLGPTQVCNPNGILICSAIFAQLTAKCRGACSRARSFP